MAKLNQEARIVAILVLVILLPVAYFLYVLSVDVDVDPKEGLRHALNLPSLPNSLTIAGSGGESWSDYLFVADLRISPEQFPELLKGRNFEPYEHYQETIEETWIQNFEPLPVTESWSWPANGDNDNPGARCTVHSNKERSRVFVRYISD